MLTMQPERWHKANENRIKQIMMHRINNQIEDKKHKLRQKNERCNGEKINCSFLPFLLRI